MGRDRRRDARRGCADERRGLFRRDVLEHHLQRRVVVDEAGERLLEEDALAVEHVAVRRRRLAVDEQRHALRGHRVDRRNAPGQIGDALRGVRRRPLRIELHAGDRRGLRGGLDLRRGRVVGQVEGHQRLEVCAGRTRSEDAVPVRERTLDRRHRGDEVRHHDRTPEAPRRRRHDPFEELAVPQVQMPVVRLGDLERRRQGFGRVAGEIGQAGAAP